MKTIFLIETDPINKSYFFDVHCGYITEVKNIESAQHYESYEKASEQLNYIVKGDFDSRKTLYLSIVKFQVKNA